MKKILSVTKDGDIAYIKKEYKLEQTKKVRNKNVVTTQHKLNSIQREIYRRLMYGLNNYTEQQRNLMSINQITKIVKDYEKAKNVAQMLTDLSTDINDADSLTNQYIAQIKIICNS